MGSAEDPRKLRRAEKAARKAQRAQEKADKARRDALEAVRASGFDVNEPDSGQPENAATDATTSATAKSSAKEDAKSTANDQDGKAAKNAKAGSEARSPSTTKTEDDTKKAADGDSPAKKNEEATAEKKGRPASSAKPEQDGNPKLAAALLAVAAVLAIVAVVGWVGYGTQKDAVASEQAETNAPNDAAEAARNIVTNMFTYDSEAVDEQLGRVEPMLTGDAEKEFRETTRPQVSSLAKETEANSYATVAAVGIEERVDADHVVTVMMLNRMVSTKDNPEAQNSSTRLRVSVDRVDDGGDNVWKVSKVEVL